MTCEEARSLLERFTDGELDGEAGGRLAQHLRDCAACRAELARIESLRKALRQGLERHRASPRLRQAVDDMIAETAAGADPRPDRRRFLAAMAASLLAASLAGSGVTYLLTRSAWGPDSIDRTAADIVASHMRSLVAASPIDVASSDRHTVKPWFAGKIDLSPPVTDFAGQGFTLVGGRLDYVDGRPVAVVVYRHREHLIQLYALPADGAGEPQRLTRNGYSLVRWSQDGLDLWAISDVEYDQLAALVALVRNAH